ncbi:MAG TPA: rod shape-determining protein RodA [Alphaproteobacteria bacterium]|nr:rod shape-determining protein RodA [Alphaproteobacteria bacterium]
MRMLTGFDSGARAKLPSWRKLPQINWAMVVLICFVAGIGFVMLYSAAGGSFSPWASRQMLRFAVGLVFLLSIAVVELRIWLRYAYLIYACALALLVAVEIVGEIGMGAQRWIDLGFFQLQPSELMKIALILALARYFHGLEMDSVGRILPLVPPLLLVAMPAILVLKQPDLGTAGMLIISGGALFFAAGVRLWKFGVLIAGGLAAIPVSWNLLHDYQRNRVLTFLDPERDPLGAGYHILQSKIAFGSGGVFGKGYLLGTQSHLNFLPEKQTDFIFTMLAEEFGLAGALTLLLIYAVLIAYGLAIAMRSRSHFGRLLAMGLTFNLFLFVFINMAMVMGIIPVVGVPLPLISYGGTAMLTVLIGFGLIMSVYVHRDAKVGRRGLAEES